MTTAPYPANSGDAWQVVIGTISVPSNVALVELHGLETGDTIERSKPAGKKGVTARWQGPELGKFTIRVESWNKDGWEILMQLCELLAFLEGDAIDVAHPMLARARITKIQVDKVKWPGNDSTKTQVAEFSCSQFAPPPKQSKPVTKKIDSSSTPDALTISKSGSKKFDIPKKTPPWKQKPPL